MGVYVDQLLPCIPNKNWRYSKSCHLIADTLEELHDFAQQLGLRRAWFQNKILPHYDLTGNKRKQALKLGAIEISRNKIKKLIEIEVKRRQKNASKYVK